MAGIAIWRGVVIHAGDKQAGDVVHVVHVVRTGSVLIAGRLIPSERTSGASSSVLGGKQTGGGVFLRDVRGHPVFARLKNISSIYGYRRVLIIPGFFLPCPR